MMKKINKVEILLVILVLIVIAAGLLLPKTGELALLDELCNSSVLWIVCVYVVVKVVRNKASKKALGAGLVIVCFALALWFSKDLVLDLSAGPQTIELKDIQVSESQGPTGIFSHHYYLTGSHNNETLRFEISAKEYSQLKPGASVTAEVYKHTRRIVSITEMM